MSLFKILIAWFGNGKRENIIFGLDAAETVICHFKTSGTDTVTDKYFNLGSSAKKVQVTVNKTASVTHINGIALKSPRTLGTGAGNVWKNGIEWSTIKVKSDQASTNFEVYAS